MPACATTTRIRRHLAWRAAMVALLGASAAQAQSFSAAPVIFPSTGDNGVPPQQVNVTLTAPSTIRSIAIPVPLNAFPEFTLVDNGGCVEDGVTVNAGGTVCSLVVRFHPQYAGVRTATLMITDGAGKSVAVPISGTGYSSQLAVLPAATRIVAGLGPTGAGLGGDGDAAVLATLNAPRGVAADSFGNLYIADTGNNVVRMLDVFGNITTVAGGGTVAGAAADGGLATAASLAGPSWLAVDAAGNLYIAETGSHVIRRVAMSSSRTITTVAGTYVAGSSGDGAVATAATLNAPTGIAVDAAGNLYIADAGNYRIRRVDGVTGTIRAFAGSGTSGFSAGSTAAASAQFSAMAGITLDTAGNLFVADAGNHAIREIAGGNVTVVAGSGVGGSSANGTVATAASLGDVEGVAVTPSGDIFFTDATAGLVRKVRSADGTLETVVATAGKSNGFTTGVRPSNGVSLHTPLGLTFDSRFTLFVADSANNVVRAVGTTPGELNFAAQAVGNTSSPLTMRVVNLGNAALPLSGVTAANSATSSNFVLNTATTDACGTTLAAAASCSFTVAFGPAASGSVTGEFDVAYHPLSNAQINYSAPVLVSGGTLASLAISPGSLAPITQGQAANIAITATGYFGTVALDTEGTLPPGMSASVSAGVLTLTGTPTAAGTFAFTVFATDSLGATATQAYSLQVLAPSVALNVTEAIHVADLVVLIPSLSLNVSEAIHVADSTNSLASLALSVNEAIHVTDTPNELPPAILAITEAIHVSDTPKQVLSLLLNVNESIHVTDASQSLLPLSLSVNEAIHVTDSPKELLPATLAVVESIHVTDTPNQTLSLLLNVQEAIHVTDSPTLVKGKAPQSITPTAIPGHTYGDLPFTVSATSSSGLPVTIGVSTGPATLNNGALTITGAGTVMLNFSQAGDANTLPAPVVTVSFNVARAVATVRALDATRALGQVNPPFSYSLSGLVRGDAATVVTGTPSLTTTANISAGTGSYPIVAAAGTLAAGNYTFNYLPGTLTVVSHGSRTVFLIGGGAVSSLGDTGGLQSTAIPAGGTGAAVDANGFVWSIDSSGTSVAKFNSSGALVADYSAGLTGATALAIDGSGQVWISNGNSVSVLSNAGTIVSTTSDAKIRGVTGIAVDVSGSVWLSSGGNDTVQQIIAGAAPIAPPATGLLNSTTGSRP